ncbi:CYTH domain-containing protein [Mammaliicoccus sciuri]|uniref:CYTH domain-containing protein n=1 Tax=Mammaliicoccus sciuri TaxID=1296 RepID=UPI0034DD2D5B
MDHSIYLGIEDYELEFEVKDYDKGEIAFNKILNDLNIERNIPNNKVVRFFNADRKRT